MLEPILWYWAFAATNHWNKLQDKPEGFDDDFEEPDDSDDDWKDEDEEVF